MATMSLQAAYDQARSYLEANKVEQAIGVAQHILEHFPENLEAHRILGEAHLASRTFDQAEASFGRVLNADPENIPAHVGLGITYERQAKLDQAVAEFEQALEVRPDMPELRSQLLRLYTDVWGSEGATLRLSRPGLARLYAKGHMLPQAIQEFRSVIDEMPERFDARVGLAEALWRDGQEDAAAEVCEEILAARPEVLKANLLLGYIKLAAGDESGEAYWRVAQQLDPYHAVARVLFDTLPDVPAPDLSIPQWDEAAWAERRAAEDAERRAAEDAERRAQQAAVAPAAVAPAAAVAASAAADEDDFFSADWMREPDPDAVAPAPAQRAVESPGVNDDFLASLLGFDDSAEDTSGGVDLDSSSGITPFNFDDVDGAPRAAAAGPSMLDVGELTPAPAEPLSLDDLGLSFDEPEQRAPAAPAAEEAPALSPLEQEMAPFSLADLGLSDDEIAELTGAPASPAAPAAAEPPADANPELAPLSLADLGLSDDEIAQLNAAGASTSPAADEPEITPFSLAELGLSDDEIAQLDSASDSSPAAPATPFSLDDLGLADDPFSPPAASPAGRTEPPAADNLQPFDWGIGDESDAQAAAGMEGVDSQLLGELEPFSLDDLDLNATDEGGLGAGSLPPSLQPFSLDDASMAPPPGGMPGAGPLPPIDIDDQSEGGGYSWQQPAAKRSTDFLRQQEQAEAQSGSIFAKLKQRAQDLPKADDEPLPPITLSDDETAAYFSSDDVPLREDDGTPERLTGRFRLPREAEDRGAADLPPAAAGIAAGAAAAPIPDELAPFSLDELGLSPEEIAALEGASAPAQAAAQPADAEPELTPFSFEDLGLSPDEIAALEGAGVPTTPPAAQPADAEPELTPFSFEELGLSPEEIAALEGASAPAQAAAQPADAEPELTPFSFEELGLSPDEIAALEGAGVPTTPPAAQPADAEPELAPFSLAELGLSPDEIAALESANTGDTIVPGWSKGQEPELTPFSLEESAPAEAGDDTAGLEPFSFEEFDFDNIDSTASSSPAADEAFAADVQPFSLDDLGLDDLDAPGGPNNSRELDLTDEELAGLDLGNLETLIEPGGEEEPEVVTGDPALDKLINLGRRQGFVDLTDIISVVDDPEAEAERIEEIGWTLHRAGIQIRDGDEIIDMEEAEEVSAEADELAEPMAEPAGSPAVSADADLTPFSFSDLGLSDEDIAALGLGEAEPAASAAGSGTAAPAPADAEPELTPFSLEELGLSPDEIAALGLDATATGAPAEPAAPPQAEAEPELAPFSLEELGLSPDEIAALESAGVEAAPAADEDPFDFGLAEVVPVERAVRTAPREEEPPPPVSPADSSFTPEPLDQLDDIWDVPAPAAAAATAAAAAPEPAKPAAQPAKLAEPARVVLPPRSREEAPPKPRDSGRANASRTPAPTRDDARYARREAARAERSTRPSERSAPAVRSLADYIPTGDDVLDDYLRQLDAEPDNHALALAVARLCAQTGRADLAALAYKRPIREGQLLDAIAEEVEGLVGAVGDGGVQRQLYRVLGDVYSKQGRLREAMAAYGNTFAH